MGTSIETRMNCALLSLDGLAIGDAVGEMLSYHYHRAPLIIAGDLIPGGPWHHTDDTEMAISVVETLKMASRIDQDTLAYFFAQRFRSDPERGYGKMTRIQLRNILGGSSWKQESSSAFSGKGSMGNGGAMRVAPLGAYFADDLLRVCHEARLASEVTHAHPEGVAGAVAIAIAAAMAWKLRGEEVSIARDQLLESVMMYTPEGQVQKWA